MDDARAKKAHNLTLEEGKCCGICDLICKECGHRGMAFFGEHKHTREGTIEKVECPNCSRKVFIRIDILSWTRV